MRKKISVLLADDHAILRSGLRALLALEPDMEVVGEASNGLEAVEMAQSLSPDVVVMDISMPELDGLSAAKRLHDRGYKGHIVILTVHAEEPYLFQTLRVGASGYVLKSSADGELMNAIRAVRECRVLSLSAFTPQAAAVRLQHFLHSRWVEKHLVPMRRADRVHQFAVRGALEHIAGRANPQRLK